MPIGGKRVPNLKITVALPPDWRALMLGCGLWAMNSPSETDGQSIRSYRIPELAMVGYQNRLASRRSDRHSLV